MRTRGESFENKSGDGGEIEEAGGGVTEAATGASAMTARLEEDKEGAGGEGAAPLVPRILGEEGEGEDIAAVDETLSASGTLIFLPSPSFRSFFFFFFFGQRLAVRKNLNVLQFKQSSQEMRRLLQHRMRLAGGHIWVLSGKDLSLAESTADPVPKQLRQSAKELKWKDAQELASAADIARDSEEQRQLEIRNQRGQATSQDRWTLHKLSVRQLYHILIDKPLTLRFCHRFGMIYHVEKFKRLLEAAQGGSNYWLTPERQIQYSLHNYQVHLTDTIQRLRTAEDLLVNTLGFDNFPSFLAGEQEVSKDNIASRTIAWNACYSLDKIPVPQPWSSPIAHQLSFAVIDPRNPNNNIATTINDSRPLLDHAQQSLDSMKLGLLDWARRFKNDKETKEKAVEASLAATKLEASLLKVLCMMRRSDIMTVPYTINPYDTSQAQCCVSTQSDFSPFFQAYL